jgi:nicotinamide phosphoribosyltransferase
MNKGTEVIYSNLTPRTGKRFPVIQRLWDNKVVVFGIQGFIKEVLIDEWYDKFFALPKEEVVAKYKRLFDAYLGKDSVPMSHFEELHDLGYLPIQINALPEGTLCPIGVPVLTIHNTDKRFAWLTNYLETVMSCELWKPMTVATIIREYRRLVNKYALETTGSLVGTEFQVHGFEFRGMSGRHDAAKCAAGFLLSSNGSDTIPALSYLEDYYGVDIEKEFVATSVPASEHSIASLGTSIEGELESYRKWITKDYPSGIVSLVSDTYDFWRVVTEYAELLKDDILNRKPNELGLAKVVFRPDSGIPEDIICGTAEIIEVPLTGDLTGYAEDALSEKLQNSAEFAECGDENASVYLRQNGQIYKATGTAFWNRYDKQYYYLDEVENIQVVKHTLTPAEKGAIECLWDVFGGTINEQGYKVLHERVGLIYGDSITLERANAILERLKAKGFASTNVVFGVGSYTSNYLTRDSLGMAVKATWAMVDGVEHSLYKDPITDDGTKKSAKGLLRVVSQDGELKLLDQQRTNEDSLLQCVFWNGVAHNRQKFADIKARLWYGV